MKKSANKIAAVVVTYNRCDMLRQCIDALLAQTVSLDAIIIVDNNSSDKTFEIIKQMFLDIPLIKYTRLPKNVGGAGGFYEGLKKGYNLGFDWLWVMDDDAEPEQDALDKLIPGINQLCFRKIKIYKGISCLIYCLLYHTTKDDHLIQQVTYLSF